jgi:hypothetical protein
VPNLALPQPALARPCTTPAEALVHALPMPRGLVVIEPQGCVELKIEVQLEYSTEND